MPRHVLPLPVAPAVVTLPLTKKLSPSEASTVAGGLLRSLLYSRAQLPCLYELLRRELETAEPSARPRQRSSARALRKTVEAVEALCATLSPEVLADAASVVIVLGSSPSRPREVFELAFAVDRNRECRVGRASDVCRRAIRELVSHFVNTAASPTPPLTRVSVLIRATQVHAAFLPRRSLKPALHKARVRVCLRVEPPAASSAAAALPAAEPALFWQQSRARFRGIKRC